jgi:hypothetical protein
MEFLAQLRLRLFADFEQLPAPCESPQYFPADLFALLPEECLVDCGAYDGDTIASFVAATGGRFKRNAAIEPDKANFASLQEMIDGSAALRERATAYPFAVDSTDRQARFAASGSHSSLSAVGGTVVEC